MYFSAVIGNPPYQENNNGGAGAGADSMYDKFILSALELKPEQIIMITKSSWFNGTRYKELRKRFLADEHIRKIVDYTNADDVFPEMKGIAGGVSYFHWDKNYTGECEFENHTKDIVETSKEHFNNEGIIIRQTTLRSVVNKVMQFSGFKSLKDYNLISGQTPFGFNTNAFIKDDVSEIETPEYSVKLIGSKGQEAWVRPVDITNNYNWLNYYKIALNQAMSGGCKTDSNGRSQVLSAPFILKPNEICTQTYLVAGISDSEEIANNIIKYYKTKFVRALLLATLTSKSINTETFQFVPIQNFKFNGDINWNQSVEDISKQLYNKYGLSSQEIDYIENTIKPIE